MKIFARFPIQHRYFTVHGVVLRQFGTDRRQAFRIAGSHDDSIHACQHRAVHGVDQGQFDLVQEVNENFAGMSLAGQPDFGIPGGDQELDGIRVHRKRNRRARLNLGRQDVAAVLQPHHVLGGILEAGHGRFTA